MRGPKPYYSREPRSDLSAPAKLFFDGVTREGELVNVSLSGGFLQVKNPPDTATVIALTVTPPLGDPIYFHASVIRNGKLPDVSGGAGVEGCAVKFLNLSPESEGRLAYLIKKKAVPRPQR